jgi:hypothetical protein
MFCPPSPDGRLRQPHKEAGETPQAEEANQIKAVKQALRRLTDPSELRQSTGFLPASGEIGDSHAPLHVRVQLGGGQEPSWARCRMQQMQQMMGCPARLWWCDRQTKQPTCPATRPCDPRQRPWSDHIRSSSDDHTGAETSQPTI